MAETPPKSNGNNGLLLDIKERKLGLTGPNVALLLLILLIGAVAWKGKETLNDTIKAGQAQITAAEDQAHRRLDQLFGRIDKLIDDLHAQQTTLNANNTKVMTGQQELRAHFDEALVRQDGLVHQQTGAIDVKIEALKQYVEDWFTEVGKRMEVMNHNTLHPDRALPLRSPVPHDDRQPERGR